MPMKQTASLREADSLAPTDYHLKRQTHSLPTVPLWRQVQLTLEHTREPAWTHSAQILGLPR